MGMICKAALLLVICTCAGIQATAQKKLLVLGSSTPACFGLSNDSCYVGRLQRYYQQRGTPVVIDNRAVGGDNCYHGMPTSYTPPPDRFTPRPYNNITEGLQGNPDIVLVNYPSNGYDFFSIDEIMFCLRTIKQAANNAGKPCYIATSQPRTSGSFQTPEVRQKMAQIKQSILNEFGPYAINFFDGIANPADNSILDAYNSGDDTHLNSAGHNVLFNRVVEKNIFSFQQAGLTYRYYEGNWNSLPDFNALTPVKSGSAANINLDARNTSDYFGFVWEGRINIPAPGTYTFETVSDDGSRFYFNTSYSAGASALVNNDGLHAPASASGSVYVAAAGSYPVAVTFFEKAGGETMQLYWSGPGFGRQPVPDAAFSSSAPPAGGLNYRYYEGNWNSLPDFNTLTPVKTGAGSNISLDPRNINDYFGFVWEGWINIPAPGQYTFETISDDGSKFYFNTTYSAAAAALVNNDGLHAPVSASGSVYIAAAGAYPVAVSFFEKTGGETMQLYWSGPGFGRQPVPDAAFSGSALPASGLAYRYYEGNWNSLPDFSSLTPVKTGNSANIDLGPRNTNDYFGFVWEGWISIPTPGTYTFETISDDGSKFYFNSRYFPPAAALVNNDGLHAPASAYGSVNIAAAGSYPIAVTFFEKAGGETMQLYWSGPGFGRQPVPDAAFHGSQSITASPASQPVQSAQATEAALNSGLQKISLYPNPFTKLVNLRFFNQLPIRQLSAAVYDLSGRLQYSRSFGSLQTGSHVLTLSPDEKQSLVPGIYFIKLVADGKVVEVIKMNKK